MKKLSILFVSLFALLVSGCAEDDTTITSSDIRVYSFASMGCNDNFYGTTSIELGKNPSVSGTYPNAAIYDLSCAYDTYVTVDFYDNGYSGHYKYFLVNGANPSYSDTIVRGGTGSYTFTFNTGIPSEYGSYYGLARVTALNLETREYYTYDYAISALENSPASKEVIAKSMFSARLAPKSSSDSIKKEDNTTKDTKVEDNSK